ncbi:uncharacterized protein LOC120072086 [Benincasa hispida]|uniref:uncharacterized protein LOC120072084 n=1 Tax=Benincasa hispida TaxID=102211 RepID=UPI001901F0F6|nr:uncharacterized protein LOC120072084 [Benincasa hispida]XP_038880431.1 uncharacterized protein LOC120072086 [Benincasa hispida]
MPPQRAPRRRGRPRSESTSDQNQGHGQTPYVLLTPDALQMVIQNMSNGNRTLSTTPTTNDTNDSKIIREFRKFNPSIFDGSFVDPITAENWITEIETIFRHMNISEEQKVNCATFMLRGDAKFWWESTQRTIKGSVSWQQFNQAFYNKYFPLTVRYQKKVEFRNLRQENKSMAEYERKFDRSSHFVPRLVDTEEKKVESFIWGLREGIRGIVTAFRHKEYALALKSALLMEVDLAVKTSTSERGFMPNQKWKFTQQGFQRSQRQAKISQSTQGVQSQQKSQTFTYPKCRNCGKHHQGKCLRNLGVCFNCGQTGHYAKACPKLINQVSTT